MNYLEWSQEYIDTAEKLQKVITLLKQKRKKSPLANKKEIDDLTPKYIARISAWKGAVDPAFREELSNMSGFVGMGKRCGLFTDDSPLAKAVADALKATSSNVKQY